MSQGLVGVKVTGTRAIPPFDYAVTIGCRVGPKSGRMGADLGGASGAGVSASASADATMPALTRNLDVKVANALATIDRQ